MIFDHDGTLVDTTGLERLLYPGIRELLESIYKMGIPMFIWTARSQKSTCEIVASLGVEKFFQDICGGDTTARKPSVEGLEYLVPEASSESVVIIGDSIGDMLGAKAYGAFAIAALWSHAEKDISKLMLDNGADKVVRTVKEVEQFILEHI